MVAWRSAVTPSVIGASAVAGVVIAQNVSMLSGNSLYQIGAGAALMLAGIFIDGGMIGDVLLGVGVGALLTGVLSYAGIGC
jgi:hypothetical protein